MNPDPLGSTGPLESLPLGSLPVHLHQVCDRFEVALQAAGRGGPRPRIEDYLADVPAAEWAALVLNDRARFSDSASAYAAPCLCILASLRLRRRSQARTLCIS